MTFYEHSMLGIDAALAVGLHRRYGWPIVALAGIAAMLPDLDGLTILGGYRCYAAGHRVWLHSFLAAGVAAAVVAVVLRSDLLITARNQLGRLSFFGFLQDLPSSPPQARVPVVPWIAVAIAAAYSHLLADVFFSSGKGLGTWSVPLLWPFSATEFACPSVPWGNAGVTAIFAAGMFAMVRWPARVQAIATVALLGATIYIAWHAC